MNDMGLQKKDTSKLFIKHQKQFNVMLRAMEPPVLVFVFLEHKATGKVQPNRVIELYLIKLMYCAFKYN